MAVNRYELVSRHNPVLREADTASPLSVGNGNLAYTADITGMQTLYGLYEDTLPLCTMTQWGWHTKPVSEERYDSIPVSGQNGAVCGGKEKRKRGNL